MSAEDDDEDDARLPDSCYKPPGRIKFSKEPIIQFSTFAVDDYDRRNEDVDPVAASAEYELEKRVEKMDTFPVDLHKAEMCMRSRDPGPRSRSSVVIWIRNSNIETME